MSIEEFNEIIKVPSKEVISNHNIKVYKDWFANKKQFSNLVHDLNYYCNQVLLNQNGDTNLRKFYSNKVFTEEEWDILLPYIFYRDFNKAFDKLVDKVLPLFNRIPQYWNDLHLEIWQGIFSFGTHWRTKDKSPKESINKPENGELYCNTLLEIYPIFKEFIDEWDNQYTLFRFCEAVSSNQYRGLLYEQCIVSLYK